jgi:TPR repeat protein
MILTILRVLILVSFTALLPLQAYADKDVPVHLCDKLAAHPSDKNKVNSGVVLNKLDSNSAILACEEAIKKFPNVMRFQYQLGRAFYKSKDYSQNIHWYRKAANNGHDIAQRILGMSYLDMTGDILVEKKQPISLIKAISKGIIKLKVNEAGNFNLTKADFDKLKVEGVNWLKKSAKQGNRWAEELLGWLYYNGKGVDENYTLSAKWYTKCAKQGSALCQNNLAIAYEKGEGVEKDYLEALKWYRKSAKQGYAIAQSNLGLGYANGIGVKQDLEKAVKWLEKASKSGEIDAQISLFEVLMNDSNVSIFNPKKAAKIIQSAAENKKIIYGNWPQYIKSSKSRYIYSELLARGYGVKANQDEAIRWMKKAAYHSKGRYVYAWLDLAHRLAIGNGVPQNSKKAIDYFKWVSKNGYEVPRFFEHKKGKRSLKAKPCSKLWADNNNLSKIPQYNTFIPLDIQFSNTLTKLNSINTKNQTIKPTIKLKYKFKDVRYLFNSKHFNTDTCTIPADVIWKSELGKMPSSWSPQIIGLNSNIVINPFSSLVHIKSNGDIEYEAQLKGNFDVKLNLKNFPFDSQLINLKFGSLPYSLSQVRLIPYEDKQGKKSKKINSKGHGWHLLGEKLLFSKEVRDNRLFSIATLELKIKRQPNYYLFKIILPIFILFLVSTSQFWLRWDRLDARVSIASSSLVAVIAYQFLIQDDLPKLPYMTLLDLILGITFFMISIGIAELALVFSLIKNKHKKLAERIDWHSRYAFPTFLIFIIIAFAIGPIWEWTNA